MLTEHATPSCPVCASAEWWGDGILASKGLNNEAVAHRYAAPVRAARSWNCIVCGFAVKGLTPLDRELEILAIGIE